MLAFNFLFLPPLHTLRLANSENWFALAVYLTTAVVVSELAARARRRAAAAEQRERESALLAGLATELLEGRRLEEDLGEIAVRAAPVLGVEQAEIELGAARRSHGRQLAHALEAAGRHVGTIYTPPDADPGIEVRRRFLAASQRCSRLLPNASGSRARRSRPRRCGAATSSRRRCSRAVSPRPALAADRDPNGNRGSAQPDAEPHTERPRRSPRDDRAGVRIASTVSSATCSTSRGSRPARAAARAGGSGSSPTSSARRSTCSMRAGAGRDRRARRRSWTSTRRSDPARSLANLIENALKFSPPDARVLVRITATRKEAIVRVVDQGPGLRRGRARAGVRAVLPAGTAIRGSGAGLGLAIARGVRRGERRPRLGGVAAGAGRDVRARAAGRRACLRSCRG